MRLSKRLERIVAMVPSFDPSSSLGGRVADVGTDHGFVPIRLVEEGKARHVIAMDVRPGPLGRAREHIAACHMDDWIETRLSDGLAALKPGEADTVVIAGMGGQLMLRILRDGAAAVRMGVAHWILSPQSELALFRHGLEELGLAVVAETMVEEDGKYYVIMEAQPGRVYYEYEYQYCYGPCLIAGRSPELAAFLAREEAKCREIIARLEPRAAAQPEPDAGRAAARLRELTEELQQIKEARHAMQRTD